MKDIIKNYANKIKLPFWSSKKYFIVAELKLFNNILSLYPNLRRLPRGLRSDVLCQTILRIKIPVRGIEENLLKYKCEKFVRLSPDAVIARINYLLNKRLSVLDQCAVNFYEDYFKRNFEGINNTLLLDESINFYLKPENFKIAPNAYYISTPNCIFSMDITMKDGAFVTQLIDDCTHSPSFGFRSELMPTQNIIIEWFRKIFFNADYFDIKNRVGPQLKLRFDASPPFGSVAVINFIRNSGVEPKLGWGPFHNQLCESFNSNLWREVNNYSLKGLEDEMFSDYTADQKDEHIGNVIDNMKHRTWPYSNVIPPGETPYSLEIALSFFSFNGVQIAKGGDPEAELIKRFFKTATLYMKTVSNQIEIFKATNVYLEFVNPFKKVDVKLPLSSDYLNNFEEPLKKKFDLLEELKGTVHDRKSLMQKIALWLQTEDFTTYSEGDRIKTALEAAQMSLTLENSFMLDEVKLQLARMENKVDTMVRNSEDKLVKKVKKESLVRKVKINQNKRGIDVYAIFPDDMSAILSVVYGNSEYIIRRDRVSLVLLKLTGMSISNLRFVTSEHLRNLINKRDCYIKCNRSNKEDSFFYLPYVPSMQSLLDLVRDDIIYLLDYLETNYTNIRSLITSIPQPNHFYSEFWAEVFIRRESLTRKLNSILKKASVLLQKKLNTKSFKHGLGIAATKSCGVSASQKILNYKSLTYIAPYSRKNLSELDIKNIFQQVHSIKNAKEVL